MHSVQLGDHVDAGFLFNVMRIQVSRVSGSFVGRKALWDRNQVLYCCNAAGSLSPLCEYWYYLVLSYDIRVK